VNFLFACHHYQSTPGFFRFIWAKQSAAMFFSRNNEDAAGHGKKSLEFNYEVVPHACNYRQAAAALW